MSETPLARLLCVDDEPNVLAAMERSLFGKYDVTVAPSGAAGLDAVHWSGPFAIILSDMRMPGMDGAEFLAKTREVAPHSVRILLTGQADVASSIAAVNKGGIFRYLCKPCPQDMLEATLAEALRQYQLEQAERQLLESTLSASVATLTELLAMVAPWAFQRAAFARDCVEFALKELDWPDKWIYIMAASLSQIGCVGIPADIVQADAKQRPLSADEETLLKEHPEVAGRLVERIPRMETVAQIIRHQRGEVPEGAALELIRGIPLLHAALELERHSRRGQGKMPPATALAASRPRIPEYIIKAVAGFQPDADTERTVRIRDLVAGWIVDEDIRTTNGLMVLTRGHRLSETAISTLRRLHAVHAITEPVRVRCGA